MASRRLPVCVRLLLCVAGLLLATTACSGTTGGSTRNRPSGGASSGGTVVPAAAACGSGVATDLAGALRIIQDGVSCAGSTNRFWSQQLGSKWTPATFLSYDDGTLPKSRCARGGAAADFADNAFYCPLDDVVAYSNQLMNRLYRTGGPYLPVVVLEHELGHRANHIADQQGVVSRSEENQADCEAGTTTHFAESAHRLPLADVLRSAKLLFELGDVSNFGAETANQPGAHGTPPQRLIAFSRGYLNGLRACRVLGQSPTGRTL
jgi:predicted metalloprotease